MRPVFTGRENDRLTRGRKRPGREEKREMEKRGNEVETGINFDRLQILYMAASAAEREANTAMHRGITAMLSGLLTAALLPVVPVSGSANCQAIGYGQGKAVDSENRPQDAVAFDAQYGKYDAYATTPDRSRIILTFDQGYENGYTAEILDTLQEKHVTAVFFITGDYAKKETELVNRMIAEGHMLGNHGMKHASLPTLTPSEAKSEIMELHDYVLETYDYEMQYFRCPCGEYSESALETIQDCGYCTLFWSDAYVDWNPDDQPDPAASLERLEEHAHGGEILLLHGVSSTNAAILGDLIDALRADGYTL